MASGKLIIIIILIIITGLFVGKLLKYLNK